MQKFLACSILSAAVAQDCDICQGREIPAGRTTYDGHDCGETVPFCEENLMICGGECGAVQFLVGGACCPVEEGPCDICQGRPMLDVIMDSGYSCAESVPFCNDFAGQCYGTCTSLAESMGPVCCPADGSEAPSDGSEATSEPAPGSCDICQGNEIIDFTLETGYSCADSVPFCVNDPAQCGGTCEEVRAALGVTCCPSAAEAAAAASTTVAPPAASSTAQPREQATEQPTEQPTEQSAAAAEEEGDGFESGAVTGATAKLTMFLVATVIGLLC